MLKDFIKPMEPVKLILPNENISLPAFKRQKEKHEQVVGSTIWMMAHFLAVVPLYWPAHVNEWKCANQSFRQLKDSISLYSTTHLASKATSKTCVM